MGEPAKVKKLNGLIFARLANIFFVVLLKRAVEFLIQIIWTESWLK